MQLSGDLQRDHHRSAEAEQWEFEPEGGHEEGLLCGQPHRADCAEWYAHHHVSLYDHDLQLSTFSFAV